MAYYPDDRVTISGNSVRYVRPTDSGGAFETFFCATCGSTLYARASKHPNLVGVAVGAMADPESPAPVRSVWEESRHAWVSLAEPVEHYPRGRT